MSSSKDTFSPHNPKLLLRGLSEWLRTRDSQSRGSLVRPRAEGTKGPVFAANENLALASAGTILNIHALDWNTCTS